MDAEAAALRSETERVLAEADAMPEPAPAPPARKPRLGAYVRTGVRGRLYLTHDQRTYTTAMRHARVDLSGYSDEDLEAHLRREVVLPGLPSWSCVDDHDDVLDAHDAFVASLAPAR